MNPDPRHLPSGHATDPDPRHLLSAHATERLTEEESRQLWPAALDDQELFDQLFEEEGLRQVITAPGARERLLWALESPEAPARSRGRQDLEEALNAAYRDLDREVFLETLREAQDILTASDSLDWRIRFDRRYAENLVAIERHTEAIDVLRRSLVDAGVSKERRETLLDHLLRTVDGAVRMRQEAESDASGVADPLAPSLPESEVTTSERRNARIDTLYAEVQVLMTQTEDESSARPVIRERLDELRELQQAEADAMRRRFEARLFLPPGEGYEGLRNARRLLAEDADPTPEHEPTDTSA